MKAAVIYWSGTGNTEQMAKAVAEALTQNCLRYLSLVAVLMTMMPLQEQCVL